jgi:hypothetical protein
MSLLKHPQNDPFFDPFSGPPKLDKNDDLLKKTFIKLNIVIQILINIINKSKK